MPATPHGIGYAAHRPVVMGRNGMVCAGHPLAAQAGVAILQQGGNAVDAAIATAAALNVVEPLMSGIGGDGFIMTYRAEDDSLRICNGTGAAPYAATPERYRAGIPLKGIHSVSVPGLLNAWLDVHAAQGRLPLSPGPGTGHRAGRRRLSRYPLPVRRHRRRRPAVRISHQPGDLHPQRLGRTPAPPATFSPRPTCPAPCPPSPNKDGMSSIAATSAPQ